MSDGKFETTVAAATIADFYVPVTLTFFLSLKYRNSTAKHSWRRGGRFIRLTSYLDFARTASRNAAKTLQASNVGDYQPNTSKSRMVHLLAIEHRSQRGRLEALSLSALAAMTCFIASYPVSLLVDPELRERATDSGFDMVFGIYLLYGPGLAVQIGGLICWLIILATAFRVWTQRRRIDSGMTAFADACYIIRMIGSPTRHPASPARADREVNELCSNLRTFADHGNPGAPAIRRKQLASHLNQVIVTLEDALEQILVRGPEAHPKVISLLSKIADRISEGRWHRLLDDEDLSDRAHSNTTENLTAQEERKDLRIVLFGVGLATLVTVGGVLAGIPSPISLTVAGLAATIPAAIGGRKHLGVTPMSLLRNTSQSLTPNQSEGQESGES